MTDLTHVEQLAQAQAIDIPDQPLNYHMVVDCLEAELLSRPELLAQEQLTHTFTDKLYVRQMFAPSGSIVTTKIHKTQHPFIVVFGKVSVFNAETAEMTHIQGPYMGITEPGTRRIAYVHEDTLWVTFHVNEDNETDLVKLEERYIERRELQEGQTAHEIATKLKQRLQEIV